MKKHRNGKSAQIKPFSICRGLKCTKPIKWLSLQEF